MDLSWLKWPSIVLVVFLVFWLLSSGGVEFMHSKFTAATIGMDPAVDKRNEAGLTSLGNYLMKTLRYSKAEKIIQETVDNYPSGENVLLNQYRLVRLYEKREAYEDAAELLQYLIDIDAPSLNKHIPVVEVLEARLQKLIEVHELNKKK
ncbi:MAG: tetratricopeptide repeat protein [FCB group bacterium]|jgi:tetratricopeptide (TPR) repeat protein|nr:tetratricopeptide repeat protein [FCB group bacterium]